MQLHWLDLLTLFIYLAGMAGLGYWCARRTTDTEGFFLGGRNFSGWVLGLSLVGTSISSISFLAYPADAFKTGWLRYLPNLALPFAVLIAARYFLPFFRDTRTTTAYEILERRFGPSVRLYGAGVFLFAQVVRISIILYLVSLMLHEVAGIPLTTCILVGGLVVSAYTIFGGITAVIWTDVVQTVVLAFGGLLCLGVILQALPGGLGQVLELATAADKLSFAEAREGALVPVGWGLGLSEKTGSMMLLLGLTVWLTEYSSNQNTVQRFCAAKSSGEARKAMYLCALFSLPIWAFFMFLGTALWAYFQVFPVTEAMEMLDGTRKAEQILPFFIINHLPAGIAGLVIAAAMAAAMSSLDSSINAIGTVGTVDLYRRHLRTDAEDAHYLRVARILCTVAGAGMILGALYLARTETTTLQDTATILVALLGGGMLGLYLLAFFTRISDTRAVWAGILATIVFTGWTLLSRHDVLPEALRVPFDLYYTGILGNLVLFGVVILAVRLLKNPSRRAQATEGKYA